MPRIRIVSIALLGSFWVSFCSLNDSRPVDAILPLVASSLTAEQQLGKELFFDTNLSQPSGQACGSCHNPTVAFTTPAAEMNNGITPGVFTSRTGPRNTPTASYAAYSPTPFFDDEAGTWVGGQFLDHRASSLEDQAKQPFLNAVEMANGERASVVADVAAATYADDFRALYGSGIFSDTDRAYEKIAQALAAYERSSEVNPFSSKFDAYLAGRANLTAQELRGLALFRNPSKGNCEACHPSSGDSPVFTDFTNDNLGVPKNSSNPFYTVSATFNPDGVAFIDRGLGATSRADSTFDGKFKVPTLRNVAITGPYMHNGVFTSLDEVLRFYNTACIAGNPEGWASPEIASTRNCSELGDLGLTSEEISDLIAFLHTLTDGYFQP